MNDVCLVKIVARKRTLAPVSYTHLDVYKRQVQAFSREDENILQFRESNAANRDANIRAQAFTGALGPTLEALSYVSLAVVAGVGGLLLLNGTGALGGAISVGLIITFISYTQQFNRPVQQIATQWATLQSAVAGAERIFGLLDELSLIHI